MAQGARVHTKVAMPWGKGVLSPRGCNLCNCDDEFHFMEL